MQCSIMGVVVAGAHTPSRGSHTQSRSTKPIITPEKGREPSPGGSGRRRGGGKRRRAITAQGPALKRTKSEDREDVNVSLRAPVPMAPPVSMPNPDATEEDWQRRGGLRQKQINAVKQFPEYTFYSGMERDKDSPQTPDPLDRDISRRRWNSSIAHWRFALKQRFIEDGHSMAATEDRHGSIATTEDITNTEDTDSVHALD